jgi:V-type H+-transporting ATPase subunit A
VRWFKVGDKVTAGNHIGSVYENPLYREHRILIPPDYKGKQLEIIEVIKPGKYTIDECVM